MRRGGGSLRSELRRISVPTPSGASPPALNTLLADMFALYMKTKNFHWHISGPHFRDYHLLLDERAEKIYATTGAIAERVRKLGSPTLRSIGDISRRQRLLDNDADHVTPLRMLAELCEDKLDAPLPLPVRCPHSYFSKRIRLA
jgi:starvation-inducible DNA-binding protein